MKTVSVNAYERSSKAQRLCLEEYGFDCTVCGFDFVATYGELGQGFIHVHHLTDLATVGKKYEDPVKDLRPVCPNCHAMLHRTVPAMAIDLLRKLLEKGPVRFDTGETMGTPRLGKSV